MPDPFKKGRVSLKSNHSNLRASCATIFPFSPPFPRTERPAIRLGKFPRTERENNAQARSSWSKSDGTTSCAITMKATTGGDSSTQDRICASRAATQTKMTSTPARTSAPYVAKIEKLSTEHAVHGDEHLFVNRSAWNFDPVHGLEPRHLSGHEPPQKHIHSHGMRSACTLPCPETRQPDRGSDHREQSQNGDDRGVSTMEQAVDNDLPFARVRAS